MTTQVRLLDTDITIETMKVVIFAVGSGFTVTVTAVDEEDTTIAACTRLVREVDDRGLMDHATAEIHLALAELHAIWDTEETS